MSGPEERRRAVEPYFTTPMTTAQVVEHLGYPIRQCLERWLAKNPRHAGHMAKPIISLETRTKAIEPVPDGMRGSGPPNDSARASELSTTGSRRIVRAVWPRCGPKTGTPARPTSLRRDEAGIPGPSAMTWRRCAAGSRSRNLENAVMRETIDVLKADDPRLDPSMLTNRERTRVVDAIRGEFGLAACLKAVGLKRSTYYYERGAIAAGDRYAVLRARVAGLFEQGGRAWGYRTIHRMLRLDESDPIVVSEKVVRRIMREGAMRPVYLKRPKRWSSYAGEIGEAPANLVERDFHADAPNMLWVTDVTQFTMDGYKCWLSPVVDCFDGMVVSWTLSRSPNADMANRMLLDAVATLRDGEHPIIHSD